MNVLDTIFDVISGIFTPLMPAIIGSGLIKGLMALFVVLAGCLWKVHHMQY